MSEVTAVIILLNLFIGFIALELECDELRNMLHEYKVGGLKSVPVPEPVLFVDLSNRGRLSKLSNEELAEWIISGKCTFCRFQPTCKVDPYSEITCTAGIRWWLEAKYEGAKK